MKVNDAIDATELSPPLSQVRPEPQPDGHGRSRRRPTAPRSASRARPHPPPCPRRHRARRKIPAKRVARERLSFSRSPCRRACAASCP